MNQPKYSIWLLPSIADRDYLSEIIQSLGAEYDAPVFDPHCTIFTPVNDLESAKTIIDQLNFKPFKVSVSGLNQSDIIWKTVFVDLETDPHLILLNYLFHQAFDTDYDFQPHISLIYKNLPTGLRKEIIHNLPNIESFWLGSISIVNTTGVVNDWGNIYEKKFID
ncbi:MAG: hypothetical protein QF842_07655 [Candidatus Marinimicrobia bacterium]|jgi:hypothetical protein|nr:hypothetical protein [Candidatus Neomarinimicrobiota bacterium]MDP6611000.1 hypothetical protein [Candidatus Neomarinimicrobiota bacterium]|tara:strand:- start:467 stop:961 length:495 start_codon:yes stop_codon:yes gene_type:complete